MKTTGFRKELKHNAGIDPTPLNAITDDLTSTARARRRLIHLPSALAFHC